MILSLESNELGQKDQRMVSRGQEPASDVQAEFVTHWQCWICKRVYRMDDHCPKCEIMVTQYDGHINDILQEVKVSQILPKSAKKAE